jgi:hypothetical protein
MLSDASISLVLFRQLFAVAVWWESAEELLCLPNPKATLNSERSTNRCRVYRRFKRFSRF